jgi:CelD/BcsL family acetyltransferase involved in cellulose biosynthesis
MPARVHDFRNPLCFLPASRHPASGHRITLTGSWEDFEARRLPRREDGRRKAKKLSQLGPVTFDIAKESRDTRAYLDAMIEFKARKFAETRVPGFEAPGKLAYFREVTRRLGGAEPVHLSALKVGDEVVASHWGLIAGGQFYHMMPGYADGPWQRYSPGRLLNDHLIRDSFERGLRVFDFGIGDEAYKHEYCDVTVDLHDHVAGRTMAGRLYLRYRAGLTSLRQTRCWEAVRPLKWVVLRAVRQRVETARARIALGLTSLCHRFLSSHAVMTAAMIDSL